MVDGCDGTSQNPFKILYTLAEAPFIESFSFDTQKFVASFGKSKEQLGPVMKKFGVSIWVEDQDGESTVKICSDAEKWNQLAKTEILSKIKQFHTISMPQALVSGLKEGIYSDALNILLRSFIARSSTAGVNLKQKDNLILIEAAGAKLEEMIKSVNAELEKMASNARSYVRNKSSISSLIKLIPNQLHA